MTGPKKSKPVVNDTPRSGEPHIFTLQASDDMHESARYILALLGIPGVGRVAAGRLAEYFPTADSILACPREQLQLRLKGVAHASEIVDEIRSTLPDRMEAAAGKLQELDEHQIGTVTPVDREWPAGLSDLDRSDRPVILYWHGHPAGLAKQQVALFAQPPLSEHAFELSQTALRHVLRAGGVPLTGARTSFDAAVHRVCASPDHNVPSTIVVSSGLGKIDKEFRPVATATVRAGGLLISSFELDHGPFKHDDRERALLQAALAKVCIFVEPTQRSPEANALDWAIEEGRSVFIIGEADGAEEAHRIVDETDFDWLEIAVNLREADDE